MELWKRRKYGDACSIPVSILDLPFCIVVEIFARLPITTLLDCKSVCKAWYSYVSDPEFGNVYLAKPPFVSVAFFSGGSICNLLELKAGYKYTLKPNSPKICRKPEFLAKGWVTLLGSCNGLLCFSHFVHEQGCDLYVCNPLTGEYALLPRPYDKRVREDAFGFGFSEKTGEYKVLRIFTRKWRPGKTDALVCTIGIDDDWRVLDQDAPLPHARLDGMDRILNNSRICEVTLNGALHWITEDLVRPDFLFSFDIGEEKIRPVPQPRGVVIRNGYTALGVLKDCLCIFQTSNPPRMDIWWMKSYGVLDSWTKETITDSCIPYGLRLPFYPIVFWREEEMLMYRNFGTLISYNPEEKKMSTEVTVNPNLNKHHSAVPYVPCFLSLKDVIKGFGARLKFVREKKTSKSLSRSKECNASTTIMDLPTYILADIFFRVPCACILSLKCVCKPWYNFISDPHYADAYFANRRTFNLVLSNKDSIGHFLQLRTDYDYRSPHRINKVSLSSNYRQTVLGSCNGLICLSVFWKSTQTCDLYIWNQLLGEIAVLPQPKVEKNIREEVYGFGFSPVTGHYKVLRVFTRKWHPGKSEAEIHTVGIDKGWRLLKCHAPLPMPRKWPDQINKARFCEITINGALHWIVEDCQNPSFICSFDITTEEVHPIPLPSAMGKRSRWTTIGVLRGCFCIFHTVCPPSLDIWWMEDYGVVGSWTKQSILGSAIPIGVSNAIVLPILVWRNGEILMLVDFHTLVSYCPKEKKFTVLNIELGFDGYFAAAPYFPSFLSLKDAVKDGHLQIANKK